MTTHVLRHTAASLWIKAGAAPFLVMKAGGCASLDVVSEVYGHLWPSEVVELGRKLDALDRAVLPERSSLREYPRRARRVPLRTRLRRGL